MTFHSIANYPKLDALVAFGLFLECLCLDDGCGYPSSETVGDAAYWHARMVAS